MLYGEGGKEEKEGVERENVRDRVRQKGRLRRRKDGLVVKGFGCTIIR
jgi:hypothetical protein